MYRLYQRTAQQHRRRPVVFAQLLSDRPIASVLHVVVQVRNCVVLVTLTLTWLVGGTQRVAAS